MAAVTIIMPAYNAENTLGLAVETILAQTYGDFRFLVANDGSTDGTLDLLHEYARQDSRLVVIDKPNEGAGLTRNLLLSMAESPVVAFADADDGWNPRKLEMQLRVLEQQPHIDVVACDTWGFDGEMPAECLADPEGVAGEELLDVFEYMVARDLPFNPATMAVRTAVLREVGGYTDDRSGQDWRPILLMALMGRRFYKLCKGLVAYRVRPGSLCHSSWSPMAGGMARTRALRHVLEHSRRYAEFLTPERIALLRKGHDRFLSWAFYGKRRVYGYTRMIAEIFASRHEFYSKRVFVRELLKTCLYPGIEAVREMPDGISVRRLLFGRDQ